MLRDGDVDRLHQAALKVLDETGIQVDDGDLRARLVAESGVGARRDRILLSPWLVEQHVTAYRAARAAEPAPEMGDRIGLSAGCCASHIVDSATREVRPVTTTDLVDAAKLIDALHDEAISGHVPGFPQDVPPDARALAEFKIGCEHMRWGGGFVAPCSMDSLELLYEMHQVVEQPFGLPLYIVSPLRMTGDSLESIQHFSSRLDHASVSSMPIMGATAPIHFAGAFVQAIAEALSGYVLLSLILPGLPIGFDIMAYCFDMARGGIVYGSPEQNLCDLIRLPVNAFYGKVHVSTRSIRTTAQTPGVQASAEKGASAVTGALAGSRHFSGAGMLSVDEVWSPEQLVIDREIADYAQRVADGFELSDRTLSLETIRDGAEVGEYLSHSTTLEDYRSVYWMPRLFKHSMLHEWQARDGQGAWQDARERVRNKLASHCFELAPEKKRELNRIYEFALRTLA